MNTAVVNIKVDPQVKKEAKKVADELGLTLSGLINAYLKQLIRTKSVSFSTVSEEPNEYLINALKKSKEDIKKGWVSPTFDNVGDAITWLDNPKKKYVNQIRKKVQ